LLARLTIIPLLPAAALKDTVQLSAVDPVTELLVQLNAPSEAVTAALPVPLRLTTTLSLLDVLLVIVSRPVAAPVASGLNCTVTLKVLPGLMLTGSALWLLAEKDCPLTLICETTTGAEP
jgi:hypothetical protein